MQPYSTLTHASDYKVVPLASAHIDDAAMLGEVLRDHAEVVADPKRNGFYWVQTDHHRFYVNVHDAARTVYLVTVEASGLGEPLVHSEAMT